MAARLMRIGELAERTGLSQPTIRHYDETGLLSPSARTAGKFRLYSEADYEKLMVIRRMKPLGFSVEEMRQLLDVVAGLRDPSGATDAERRDLLDRLRGFLSEATARRDKLKRNLEWADDFISVLRAEETSGRGGAHDLLAQSDGHRDAVAPTR
ncbi:DNA-binding transcriptional regulator, MerR family [Geodermatophilus dictyosporus]|uniref:DNA-binding transcriptional regulator, MerR family n=1 Tax=Geodermatophilus dictyosporus TaxID=1523247 RepID=A0A1I5MX47_9ACTN|nr:MerR family transcriptional regulator [Geodermatophilus dictyosporus]SFP14114.1 DNA-binding transcriptional regulator, MerR family [Geodermatophilus dictyosporus]